MCSERSVELFLHRSEALTGGFVPHVSCLCRRDAAGHPGEMWSDSSDQLGWLLCGRRNGRRWIPKLHHLHWDVLCCRRSAPRLHLQGLHGQTAGLVWWVTALLCFEAGGPTGLIRPLCVPFFGFYESLSFPLLFALPPFSSWLLFCPLCFFVFCFFPPGATLKGSFPIYGQYGRSHADCFIVTGPSLWLLTEVKCSLSRFVAGVVFCTLWSFIFTIILLLYYSTVYESIFTVLFCFVAFIRYKFDLICVCLAVIVFFYCSSNFDVVSWLFYYYYYFCW